MSGGEGGFSFAAGLAQMLGSLALVLGLIHLLSRLSRGWLKGGVRFPRRQNHIRVVETRHLAPKKSLLLVEVAGEYLLLSNGADGVNFIKQIDMLEEIEVIEVLEPVPAAKGRFQERLDGLLASARAPRLMPFMQRSQG